MCELRRAQLRALLNEEWGKDESARPKLTIVGKPLPSPTPADTFRNASESIGDFAQRLCDGTAGMSEIEDADILLLGMRRLLEEKMQALEVQS